MTSSEFTGLYIKNPKSAMIALRYDEQLKNELLAKQSEFVGISLNEAVYMHLNPDDDPICPWCQTNRRKFFKVSKGYASTCVNSKCKKAWRSDLNKKSSKKIDWEGSISKREATNMATYGAKSNLSAGTESRDVADRAMEEIYGTKHPLKNPDILNRRNQTTLQRHGTLNFVTSEKAKATLAKNHGVANPMESPEIRDRVSSTMARNKLAKLMERCNVHNIDITESGGSYVTIKCRSCETIHTNFLRQSLNILLRSGQSPCNECNPINRYRSNGESELADWVKSVFADEIHTNRKYLGTELDIMIPDLKLAIEYNGVYWHSDMRKPKRYHIKKKKAVEDSGWDVVQIWEDHWNDPHKREIIKSKLIHKLGMTPIKIGARSCKIIDVSPKQARAFMEEHHLYGSVNSQIRIGLEYRGELVMLCTFGRPRMAMAGKTASEYELLRMASKKGHLVIGGLTKSISELKRRGIKSCMTYADCDWTHSKANGYSSSGFKFVKWTDPGYHWVVNGIRHNRMSFMRSSIPDISENETVDDYMYARGRYKTWNSGNLLYMMDQ